VTSRLECSSEPIAFLAARGVAPVTSRHHGFPAQESSCDIIQLAKGGILPSHRGHGVAAGQGEKVRHGLL
jgi:hypothetical protein